MNISLGDERRAVWRCVRVMGMKFAPILDPHVRRPSPKPMQVDLRKAFLLGILLWSIALVSSLCLWLLGHIQWFERASIICGFGIVLGLAMLVWEHFDRWDYRRLGK